MARMTAILLRERARAAMLDAGGRGFVRFPEQGALLVCDALRRCEGDEDREKLHGAMEQAGFACCEQDGILYLMPGDKLLAQIDCAGACEVDWDGPLCGVQALANRWLQKERMALTSEGRQLIVDTLRLTWQDRVLEGLAALRAKAAVMQRNTDTSGFYEAGAVLHNWCKTQEGRAHEA